MIVDQLFSPKPLKEGGPYDLPGKDYDRPGDTPRRPRPQGDTSPRRHPDDPDFMDPDQRRLRADQERVKKAWAAKNKGVAEEETPFGSVSVTNTPSNQKPYAEPSRQDIWDKNDLVNRQAEVREQKQLTLRYARKHGRQAMENLWAERTDVRMRIEEILEFLDATINDPGLTPEEFMGTKGLDEGSGQDSKSWMASIRQQHPDVQFVQAKMPGAPIMAMVNGKPVAQWDGKADVVESKRNKQRKLNEALLMEDPVYRNFKQLGQYIAEQKLTEPEILQIFSDAETGMTDRATGANRTFLGRGKDTTMDFAGGVKDAVSSVLNSIQTSTPVAAVDVAYDQATDALANVAGGQKGAVMAAIKKYRNLVKEYPKTAGFAKAALVAIAGLATGGAGLPAIAGLTYALDSAIKGDKLSSVIGKGAGTAALAAAGQAAFGSAPADASSVSGLTLPDADAAINSQADLDAAREWINADEATRADIEQTTGMSGAQLQDIAVSNDLISNADSLAPGASRFDSIASNAVDYQVKQGDTLSDILADRKINPEAFKRLPGNEVLFGPDGNPNILKAGQTIKLPDPADVVDLNKMSYTTPSDPNLAKDFDTTGYAGQYNQNSTSGLDAANNLRQQELGRFGSDSGMSAARVARDAVRESIKFKIIPASKLIDQKATVLNWALNESVGRRSQSVNLTTIGALTVFENVDRYRRAIVEYTQPGREQIPNLLRPDMPGSPVTPDPNPGMIGRGLNALDRFTSRVGGGLSNFGRQFTTGVTKEKLKMNWHQAGKPTDSDQLAAWLVTQKVPQQVVTDVFSKMGIPYTAPTTQPTAQPAAQAAAPKTGGASTQAYAGINPATKKPWTQQELRDKFYPEPATDSTASADTEQPPASAATATSATAPAAGTFPGEDPKGPGYVGRREVARRQAARDAEAAKKPAAPNFAQQGGGYKSVTYAPNIKTGANLPKPTAPAAPTTTPTTTPTKTPTKTPTQAERDAYVRSIGAPAMAENRIAMALKKPVAEMLQMVETKEDVQRIKQFVDDTFVKHGAVNESAFAMRNQILEHVTQVGAQRRREHSQRLAH